MATEDTPEERAKKAAASHAAITSMAPVATAVVNAPRFLAVEKVYDALETMINDKNAENTAAGVTYPQWAITSLGDVSVLPVKVATITYSPSSPKELPATISFEYQQKVEEDGTPVPNVYQYRASFNSTPNMPVEQIRTMLFLLIESLLKVFPPDADPANPSPKIVNLYPHHPAARGIMEEACRHFGLTPNYPGQAANPAPVEDDPEAMLRFRSRRSP